MAERAVTHGLSLAKIVGAKVTVVIAEKQVVSWSGGAEAFLRYTEHIKKHATSVLDRVANNLWVQMVILVVAAGVVVALAAKYLW